MITSYGKLEDGREVESIRLASGNLEFELLTYGAILRRLTFPVRGERRESFLNFATLGEYERDRAYVGPVVGRFGNRIANSRFTLDGREHVIAANEGANHLHGGLVGFGKRLWRIVDANDDRATLTYRSPAGEEGYPGTLDATLAFELRTGSLAISLRAVTDAPTPVNLTYHPYFNINANVREPATDMRLRIPASHYLPVRTGLIPTGERAPVAGTTFDFRASRKLAPPEADSHEQLPSSDRAQLPLSDRAQLRYGGGYDHCWILDGDADCACELTSANGDATLTMLGTGPGLQFYNGQFLSRAHPTLGNGVILEPQGLPNAPNEPGFPNSIVRPGETWRARIEYRLRAN